MSPAINDPVMVLLLRVLSLVLSASIILACVRAFIFFGGAIKSQENLEKAVEKAGVSFERFVERVDRRFAEHEAALTTVTLKAEEHDRRFDTLERRQTKRRSEDRDHHDDSD